MKYIISDTNLRYHNFTHIILSTLCAYFLTKQSNISAAQSIAESEYNVACTAGMSLAHFRMLIHELLNKDPDIVPD